MATDNLTYTYTVGTNQLQKITDAGSVTNGFVTNNSTANYTYDQNGSLKTDPYKGLTITYNHLNLPSRMDFGSNKVIDIKYDASGKKLRQWTKNNGTTVSRIDYVDGIEYQNSTLEAIYHAEGRVFINADTLRYEYVIRDHLGNTRLAFTDKNNNGLVDVTNTTSNEILQENHYFPFGMAMPGPWMDDVGAVDTRFKFNGIEEVSDFGLGFYTELMTLLLEDGCR